MPSFSFSLARPRSMLFRLCDPGIREKKWFVPTARRRDHNPQPLFAERACRFYRPSYKVFFTLHTTSKVFTEQTRLSVFIYAGLHFFFSLPHLWTRMVDFFAVYCFFLLVKMVGIVWSSTWITCGSKPRWSEKELLRSLCGWFVWIFCEGLLNKISEGCLQTSSFLLPSCLTQDIPSLACQLLFERHVQIVNLKRILVLAKYFRI